MRVVNRISREIDDLDVRPQGSRLLRQFETIDARHLDIGDQEADPLIGKNANSLIRARRGDDQLAWIRKGRSDYRPKLGIIIDKQDRFQMRPAHWGAVAFRSSIPPEMLPPTRDYNSCS